VGQSERVACLRAGIHKYWLPGCVAIALYNCRIGDARHGSMRRPVLVILVTVVIAAAALIFTIGHFASSSSNPGAAPGSPPPNPAA
jgi:uncharacterized membrane protein